MCWSFLPHVRFLILLTVFELLPKTCNFTICSIFSNSGHVGWCTVSPDKILKLDTLVMIQTKFGFHWSSTFRGEDFWKSLRRTMDDDDGRQVMRIAHLTLWVRWAKKGIVTVKSEIKKAEFRFKADEKQVWLLHYDITCIYLLVYNFIGLGKVIWHSINSNIAWYKNHIDCSHFQFNRYARYSCDS